MTEKRARKPKAKAVAKAKPRPAPPPPAPSFTPNRAFPLNVDVDASRAKNAREVAKQILAPETAAFRMISAAEGKSAFGEMIDTAGVLEHMRAIQTTVNAGDLSAAEAMLTAQAISLQTLSARLVEKAMAQEWMPQFETFMRLGLKAQRQSCLTLEALGALKHGPAILARNAQVNVAHGPQQVNNAPAAPVLPPPLAPNPHADAAAFEIPPSKLLCAHGEDVDTRATQGAGAGDPEMAPVGKVDRPEVGRGKKPRRTKSR